MLDEPAASMSMDRAMQAPAASAGGAGAAASNSGCWDGRTRADALLTLRTFVTC